VIRRLWAAACGAALVWPVLALAAQDQNPATEGFVPVQPGDLAKEQLPAAPLVFAAYAFVWLALVVYVFSLWRRMSRVERDLADVNSRLQARR
jgi:CcmD family protein